ncbi:protein PLASTID REDOX INSENSITIVE 2, chloroplastic-like isoform X3 [Quercus robur]|uniref:protein PLASTID REDOX INSENSITIVE 2, chloroplastic-like isoform X3 n=1 Tax=Quercus robur TaxID=38942 RepID=UPI0021610C49|nr:protein PLASTID REDOX INSENSITIVE 2, chloroplastic-like isoform X3 [Quercus robur]
MTMALYPSILTQTNLFSPAKPKPLSSTSKPLFLRTPCLILRLHSPTPSSSTFSAKPISQISLTTSLRASSPQKYVYPDPIPEFAEAEIRKFRAEVLRKLLKDKDTFGDELDAVVDVCAEIITENGTLKVISGALAVMGLTCQNNFPQREYIYRWSSHSC